METKEVIKQIDTKGNNLPPVEKLEVCSKFEVEPISICRLTIMGEITDIVFVKINGKECALQVATNEILSYLYQFLPEKPNTDRL